MHVEQFRALQEHLKRGEHDAAEACAARLRASGLRPIQQALVLQLQGQRQRSLELRFSPLLALRELEQCLLPLPQLDRRAHWLPLLQRLVTQGHGPLLLRLLARLASRYPLQQHRHELIEAINSGDGLLMAGHPELRPLWQRLQRLLTPA